MSLKKTLLAVAAVGALSAATAVPASALENEFHGLYKMKYFVSNLDNGGGGFYAPTDHRVSAMNYFEQRARLFYNAKANDDLKLVVAFEIDYIFGDKAQGTLTSSNGVGTTSTSTAFRNSGGAFDTDAVNLETKWVHLDFNVPGVPMNVKVGTQAIKDNIKGILFDVDAAGVQTMTKLGDNAKLGLGYFRGYAGIDGSTGGAKTGVNNADLVTLDTKFNLTKDLALGASYYGYFDYRDATRTLNLHTGAFTADAAFGPVALSGFLAGQTGTLEDKSGQFPRLGKTDFLAWAANLAAKVKAGPGSLRAAALYTSGDNGRGQNNAWQSLQYSPGGVAQELGGLTTAANTYNESGMMLLNRNAASAGTTTDRAIVYTTNNKNQGVLGLFAGYDMNLSKKLSTSFNGGVAWAANENSAKPINRATGRVNSSDFLGAEVNAEVGYKLYDNLTASLQAAYVFLGGYYKNTATGGASSGIANLTVPGFPAGTPAVNPQDPMNPYTGRVVLTYAF